MDLFRAEAVDSSTRFSGDVSIAPPVSWQGIGYFLGGLLAVSIIFLSLGTYGQSISVTGEIEASGGVTRVIPSQTAILSKLLVREGQLVRQGEIVARLERSTSAGNGVLEDRRAAALSAQRAALGQRLPLIRADVETQIAQRRIEIDIQRRALLSMEQQIGDQRALLATARLDLARAQDVAKRGFVSGNDLRAREEMVASRRQALLRMEQERDEAVARRRMAEAEIRRGDTRAASESLDVAREQSALDGLAAGDLAQRWISVTAPASGIVTGITASPGASVAPETTLFSIVPKTAHLRARLAVPPEGVGFMKPGQTVAIALEAFPREIYGALPARITTISSASVPVRLGAAMENMFVATATLDRPFVKAYGETLPLRPGMTFRATITTRRQNLIRWLLAPLFAVMDR